MRVSQIVNGKTGKGVITVSPETTVTEVARLLSQKGIGAVVVSADGARVDGILSERDLVRGLGRRWRLPRLDPRRC